MQDLHPHLSQGLARFVDRMIKVKTWFLVFSCLIMAVTFFFVVIFRYVLNADLFAYEEWLLIICFWMYFVGSAVATHDGSHVTADLLSYVITDPKKAHVRALIIGAIELFVTCFLIYWALLMLIDEIDSYPRWRTTIALRIPFLVPRIAIFVGFAMMAFYSALHLWALWKSGPSEKTGDVTSSEAG
ncbi:TRAP transporter small permease subunit [Thalassobius sp. I31.1]|uniref:TRAP transporter small permease n=1 Tax=Thalassobius sp. I31.1 TaxID=2109912 RepID=UPI000D1B17FB|nr:TRAP transporter small permease subunit [Thalassobius sp. I31.1]